MKKNQWIYLVIAAGIAYYYFRKVKSNNAKISQPVLTEASAVAADVVDSAVSRTTFVEDDTTDRDRYSKQQGNCL